MATVICSNCGCKTNTAVSDHLFAEHGKARKCYAAVVEAELIPGSGITSSMWVRGCGYDDALPFDRQFADKVIATYNKQEATDGK